MTGFNAGGPSGYGMGAPSGGANPMGVGAAPRRLGAPLQPSHAAAPQAPGYPQTPHYTPEPQPAYGAAPTAPSYGYAPAAAHAGPGIGAGTGMGGYHPAPQTAPQYDYATAPEEDYGAYETELDEEDRDTISAANWIGALCSLALVLGLVFWGYQTIQRDVSGVPVIQAMPGPMRIQPDDPGGLQASHQGLAVNSVQAEGRAADMPDQVVLAPQALDLSAEGIAAATLPAVNSTQNGSAAALVQPNPNLSEAEQTAAYARLADQLAAGVQPLDGSIATAPTEDGGQVTLRVLPQSTPGIVRSPRPVARPAAFRTNARVQAQAAVVTAAQPAGPFVNPASIPSGTRLVQFGAYDSPAIARSEWERLSTRFRDFMDDKRPVVQQALSGGREFHRLRVIGFADVNEARRFCSVFLAENTPCIPVVAK